MRKTTLLLFLLSVLFACNKTSQNHVAESKEINIDDTTKIMKVLLINGSPNNNMPLVSSQYWNMVHGNTPDEVKQDKEGMQIMRTLGRNMAWLLKSMEEGEQHGLEKPEAEPRERTNFIR